MPIAETAVLPLPGAFLAGRGPQERPVGEAGWRTFVQHAKRVTTAAEVSAGWRSPPVISAVAWHENGTNMHPRRAPIFTAAPSTQLDAELTHTFTVNLHAGRDDKREARMLLSDRVPCTPTPSF